MGGRRPWRILLSLLLVAIPSSSGLAAGVLGTEELAPVPMVEAEEVWSKVLALADPGVRADLSLAPALLDHARAGDMVELLGVLAGPAAPVPQLDREPNLRAELATLATLRGLDQATIQELMRTEVAPLEETLSPAEATALAGIVAAHRAQLETHAAYWPLTAATREDGQAAGLAAHRALAHWSLELHAVMSCHPGLSGTIRSLVTYDLACEDSVYTADAHLLVDLGGDDIYQNNAGATDHSIGRVRPGIGPAAAAIDLGGNDAYVGTSDLDGVFNGAADVGLGFLLDADGNDRYEVQAALGPGAGGLTAVVANGAGRFGLGTLLDLGGDDTYNATSSGRTRANGAAFQGMGVLVDVAGEDTYRATAGQEASINGGADDGVAWLLDGSGEDRYVGSAGNAGAINGGTESGAGHLLDGGGADVYLGHLAVRGGVNGGGSDGPALLLDAGDGDDRYSGTVLGRGAVNGAAFNLGTGILWDEGGNDVYEGLVNDRGGVNGAAAGGLGLLRDMAGDDRYHGAVLAEGGVNGASAVGVGVLIDDAGDNLFTATTPSASASHGASVGFAYPSITEDDDVPELPERPGVPGVLGLLWAGPGDDRYWTNGTGQGTGTLYGKGILVDTGGENTYHAGPGADGRGLAQGAGTLGGLGMLVDRGTSTFHLAAGVQGQGVGLQGAGLVLHVDRAATALFRSAQGATAGLLDGAGFGLRLSLGTATLEGPQTPFTCEGSPELAGASATLELAVAGGTGLESEVHVCAPEDEREQPILNPLTGEPLPPQPKPRVFCQQLPLLDISCADISPDLAAFLAASHVEMTTGGGARVDLFPSLVTPSGAETSLLNGRLVLLDIDGMCRHGCVQQT